MVEAFAAGAFLLGAGGDNDTNYQLMDNAMVGNPRGIVMCKELAVSFFKDMEYASRSVKLIGFSYRVPLVRRPARGGRLEPFFGSRDPAHTTKAVTRTLCTPACALHFGELVVVHAHGLEKGMPLKSYVRARGQSDQEAAERIAASNFSNDTAAMHWTEPAHLLFSFLLRLGMKPWWSKNMEVMQRFICSAVPFHFYEGARMLNASSDNPRRRFFHGATYLCIHRTLVHQMLRTMHWPEDWPPYNGRRQVEYFGEMRFEAKRRLGPPHGMAAKDFVTATNADHAAQVAKAFDAIGGASDARAATKKAHARLSEKEASEQNMLAIRIAMRLLALCCPAAMPNATREGVRSLVEQYKAWCEKRQPALEDDPSDSDASDSNDSSPGASEAECAEDGEMVMSGAVGVASATKGAVDVDPVVVIAQRANHEALLERILGGDGAAISEAVGAMEAASASRVGGDEATADGDDGDDGGFIKIFTAILDYGSVTCLADLFVRMRAFLRTAEEELPHGLHCAHRRKLGVVTEHNQLIHDLAHIRSELGHSERNRLSRMAGWAAAGARQFGTVDAETGSGTGCPKSFWIFHKSRFNPTPAQPQILVWDSDVVLTIAVHGRSAHTDHKDRKSYLQYKPLDASMASTLALQVASERPAKGGIGLLFHFRPSSPARVVKLTKKVLDGLVQLEVQDCSSSPGGLIVAVTAEAEVALHSHRAEHATLAIQQLAKKTQTEAADRVKLKAIVAAPMQYVEEFIFHSQAFTHTPTSSTGQAEVRTGLRYTAELRAKTLGVEMERVPDLIERVLPSYCHAHFYQSQHGKKVTLHRYR